MPQQHPRVEHSQHSQNSNLRQEPNQKHIQKGRNVEDTDIYSDNESDDEEEEEEEETDGGEEDERQSWGHPKPRSQASKNKSQSSV